MQVLHLSFTGNYSYKFQLIYNKPHYFDDFLLFIVFVLTYLMCLFLNSYSFVHLENFGLKKLALF
jgi:hypothetical protein